MYILTYDLGTTAVKTSLYLHEEGIFHLVDAEVEEYGLHVLPNDGAEQDPEEWWEKIKSTTARLSRDNPRAMNAVAGISFCSQMQALVLVDKHARAIRPAISFIDQRGKHIKERYFSGQPKISGMSVRKLLASLNHTGVASASAKDPVWKYLWVKHNEPEVFAQAYKWLDVKDYIAARMTGNFMRSEDSAFTTLLVDRKSNGRRWSAAECQALGIDIRHLPPIVDSSTIVGGLRKKQAEQLGMTPGIPVFAGGGDASLIGVGAGAGMLGSTHIYWGTSGWVSTTLDHMAIDISTMCASVTGAEHGLYNYFAEMHTAGKCFEWVRDHLAKDEINLYVNPTDVATDPETRYTSMYEYMSEIINRVPAGSNGVIFTPWLCGSRAPFEDPYARGVFFNLGIETCKTDLLRAVLEGVCMHLRWLLESEDRKVKTSSAIRFAGGGALSPTTAQILADIIHRPVETVASPQNVGGVGAAMLVAVGLGAYPSLSEASAHIEADRRYLPTSAHQAVYDTHYEMFKKLYAANKGIFESLNHRS